MDTIWVGEVEGNVLVYDPAIQLPECPHLFLWDPALGDMGKYIADLTRKYIKPHSSPSDAAAHVMLYRKWRNAEGKAWLEDQKRHYASRRSREAAQEQQRLEREATQEQERLERERCKTELELRKAEAERYAKLTPEERHKQTLEKLGKDYYGTRLATLNPGRSRITHCYSCKNPLDNSIDIECVACSWILCRCGACGCGYERYA